MMEKSKSTTCLAALILAGASTGAFGAVPAGGFHFELNDRPARAEVFALDGSGRAVPAAGDVVKIADMLLRAGKETPARLRSTPDEDGRVLAEAPGGRLVPVGAKIGRTFYTVSGKGKAPPRPPLPAGLKALGPAGRRGLRGILLQSWPPGVEDFLKGLDPDACVTVHGDAALGPDEALPPLPAGLRCLGIEGWGSGFKDYSSLGRLKDLEFLSIQPIAGRKEVDARLLKGANRLKFLSVSWGTLEHPEALASLKGLRSLSLVGRSGLEDVSVLADLSHLRSLDIRGAAVRDLRPLAKLDRLERLAADMSAVEELPESGWPSLKRLDLLGARVSDAKAASFRAKHPACAVRSRWAEALASALAGADRVRVRTGGGCHRRVQDERALFETSSPWRIGLLLSSIRVDEARSTGSCMCCGDPSIEFYRGGALLDTLTVHHGVGLRWEGWPADAELSPWGLLLFDAWLETGAYAPLGVVAALAKLTLALALVALPFCLAWRLCRWAWRRARGAPADGEPCTNRVGG